MYIFNASIRKTNVVVVFSFLFVFLISSIVSAQHTYAKKIKVEEERAQPNGIISTSDGGNVLLFREALVRKINASGRKVWQRELHLEEQPDNSFVGRGVAELSDGSYVVAGDKTRFFLPPSDIVWDSEPWLVKLTPEGKIDWQKRFVESDFGSVLSSVVPSGDGGFFAAGKRGPEFLKSGDPGIIVASFDYTGKMRWGKAFRVDFFHSAYFLVVDFPVLFVTSNQELILVSPFSGITAEDEGTLVLKLDADGNLSWKKLLRKKDLQFTSGAVTADGGCILLFSSGALRLSSNGKILWKKSFRVNSQAGSVSAVTQTADGGFAVAGTVNSSSGEIFVDKLFLAKLDSAGTVVSSVFSDSTAVDNPEFILPTSDSGYVVFGSSEDAFLLKLDSNANLPGCNPFSAATIASRKFGALETSSPTITINTWRPRETSSEIRSKKLKVTSSQFCP